MSILKKIKCPSCEGKIKIESSNMIHSKQYKYGMLAKCRIKSCSFAAFIKGKSKGDVIHKLNKIIFEIMNNEGRLSRAE